MSAPLPDLALGVLAAAGLKATVGLALALGVSRALTVASASSRHAVLACGLATGPALLLYLGATAGPELTLGLSTAAAVVTLAVWAAGVLVALFPLCRGLVDLSHLAARGRWRDGVVWSPGVEVPMTFGRIILMPERARAWPAPQRQAALLHERAHLERGDWWVHAAAWASCALLWFHPLAWAVRRKLMLEAERAADDRVLLAGIQPSDYAQQLLGLVGRRGAGVAMGPTHTAVRVRAVLGAPNRSGARWPAVSLCAVAAWALAAPVSGAALWASPAPLHCQPAGAPP